MLLVFGVEVLAVYETYIILDKLQVPRAIRVLLATCEQALEDAFQGALLLLVYAVKHSQHYVARL